MRNIVCSCIFALLIVSCSHSHCDVNMYKSDVIDVYDNTDESRVIGLSSLCVLKNKHFDGDMETIEYFRDFCIAYKDLFIWDLKEIITVR